MIPSVRLPYRKITAAGFCFAAIVLRYGIALGQQPRRPCAEEVTKPLLEVALDTHLQETDPVRVRGAIQELGQKRCVEVIDDLVSVLTFRFPYPKDANEPGAGLQPIFTGSRYPATGALFAIGTPALPSLLKVIETYDAGSLEAKNARYTGRTIFREEPTDADKFFKAAAAKARTREAKQRLLKALETPESDDFKSD